MEIHHHTLTSEVNFSEPKVVTVSKPKKKRLSVSELKKKMVEFEEQFIKPTPQEKLGGELGVTLFDIAQSLGTSHAELKRKIERTGIIQYLKAFGYQTMTSVIVPAVGPRSESYILCTRAAEHVVAKYDNFAGRYYLDFLIRSKDALKVSLDQFNRMIEEKNKASLELDEAKKLIDKLMQPKIARRNRVTIKNIVADKSSLFHDTTYRIEHQTIRHPKKGDKSYNEHYIQKLSKITKGNAEAIRKALGKVGCDKDILNKKASDLLQVSAEVDSLINPDNMSDYASAINGKINR